MHTTEIATGQTLRLADGRTTYRIDGLDNGWALCWDGIQHHQIHVADLVRAGCQEATPADLAEAQRGGDS